MTGLEALASHMGVPVEALPTRLFSATMVPWNLEEVCRVAFEAGRKCENAHADD